VEKYAGRSSAGRATTILPWAGRRKKNKFRDFYGETLRLYGLSFPETPPADTWPYAGERFQPNATARIDLNRYFVFRKPAWWPDHALVKLIMRPRLPVPGHPEKRPLPPRFTG